MMAGMITLILTGLLRGVRTRRALVLENLALRHQLAVLQRAAPRPRLRRSDRLFWVLLSRLWSGWADAVSMVQPETVIRWQRTGFRLCWTWKSAGTGQAARPSPWRPARRETAGGRVGPRPSPSPSSGHRRRPGESWTSV
jgi:putative transposase